MPIGPWVSSSEALQTFVFILLLTIVALRSRTSSGIPPNPPVTDRACRDQRRHRVRRTGKSDGTAEPGYCSHI